MALGQLDFALIGNCQVSALVDSRGRMVWACLPQPDAPAVFASLLSTEEAGSWSMGPVSGASHTTQAYLDRTNVVRTEVTLEDGTSYELLDFAPRYALGPGSYHRPSQFHRVVRPLSGTPRLKMEFIPRFDYGRVEGKTSPAPQGIRVEGEGQRLTLQSSLPVAQWGGWDLDRPVHFVLGSGEPVVTPVAERVDEDLDRTTRYWRHWIKHCRIPLRFQDEVIRSALALKLHVFEETGGILAATTTSLPESPHGGRNWDYRYCWLRDAYFVVHAFGLLERVTEIEGYTRYLQGLTNLDPNHDLQPVYGLRGERELTEIRLPWLNGFRGLGPVRVGNAAWTHNQYDVYGEWVLSLSRLFYDRRMDPELQKSAFEAIAWGVEKAISVFDKPDAGLWEIRGEESHYVFTKVMLWSAVDQGIRIAAQVGRGDEFAHWETVRTQMRAEIEEEGWNADRGYYSATLGGDMADASNLLMGALGFHPHDHPRFQSMREGYERELVEKGYVFRYRREDDFGVPRHAFTICSYWYVDFLLGLGHRDEAENWFTRLLSTANHVGLISEDVDQESGELWGNFPQTYSHVGVIQTAFRLSEPVTVPDLNTPS